MLNWLCPSSKPGEQRLSGEIDDLGRVTLHLQTRVLAFGENDLAVLDREGFDAGRILARQSEDGASVVDRVDPLSCCNRRCGQDAGRTHVKHVCSKKFGRHGDCVATVCCGLLK